MLKKTKPVFPSRTARSKRASDGSFSITSWFKAVCNGPGSATVFSGISPIEPASGPRKASLKTRIVKKELGPTWKRNVSGFASFVPGSGPIEAVQIEIHRHASLRDDHLFQSAGLSIRAFLRELWCRIPRAVAQKQKQREREITQHFPYHHIDPPIRGAFRTPRQKLATAPRGRRLQPVRRRCHCSTLRAGRCKGPAAASP